MNHHRSLGRWIGAGLATFVVMACSASQARAHFLFIRIGAQAEAGRAAEVYFSEQAEAGDPRLIAKVAHTKLWAQTEPGVFRELAVHQGADRLRAALPPESNLVVVGECQYGVLARPKETPFLLRYYPKAVAGVAAELNRMKPKGEIPFQIQPTFESDGPASDKDKDNGKAKTSGGRVRLVALRHGKPIPNAVFTRIDSELSEETIKAGPDGTAVWTPSAPGRYSVYVRDTLKQPGTLDGKPYDEVREFATLALNWPLQSREADPAAVALFTEAIAHRASWRDFPGFSAQIKGQLDGRTFAGNLTVQADGSVDVKTDDPVASPWLKSQFESMVMHRLPPPSTDSSDSHDPSGARQFRFADSGDDHPFGRLLTVEGGQMASSYRIKDRQIMVVNRRMGKQQMTITMLENETNPEGRFLPHSYVVHYWDAATGKLKSIETFQERWKRIGTLDLPTLHTVTTASDAGLSVRSVVLSDLKLGGTK
jgi:Protein of unknown function (DUF3386)